MDFIEVSAKTVEDAITEALVKLGTTSDKIEYEIIEKGASGILGFGRKDAVIKVRKKNDTLDNVREFLAQVFDAMQLEVESEVTQEENSNIINVELKGEEMGVLIGKRGQTLDSLQYLTNLAVNKNAESFVKVKIDTEDYRKRRRDTLENLARNIAYKVKKTRRPVSLEPMNPSERRVIHYALQNDKYVTTHSEGDEPYRHVVVTLKREARNDYRERDGRDRKPYRDYRDKNRKNYYEKEKKESGEETVAESPVTSVEEQAEE